MSAENDVKRINVKRIILNIGLLMLLFAFNIAGISIYENRNAEYTQATVLSGKPSVNMFFHKPDGTREPYDEITVEYAVDGKTYSGTVDKLPGEYEIGGKVEYCYDRSNPDEYFYDTRSDNLTLAGALAVVSVIIIFLCRRAFSGYKRDYLCRYRKQVIFSVVTGWIPILYFLWYEFVFDGGSGIMAGLSEFLIMIFLFAFVPVLNIAVWIIAAIKYCRGKKSCETEN